MTKMQTIIEQELILIVDDNTANIEVAEAHLISEGFRVDVAKSAREALEKISSISPDLILLDVMMPVVDGFELCKIIKSNDTSSDIPIIFITAINQSENMVKGFSYGAVDYIAKPFNKDELVSRVKNHLKFVNQTRTIKIQNEALRRLNEEKNGIIELTAHDLNNPLQSVLGYTEMLLSKIPIENTELISYIHTIRASTNKAVGIIKDLMEVNLIEEGKLNLSLNEFDLRDILVKVIDDYMFLAETKKQKIIYNETDNACLVYADKSKLGRVFDNLLSNALKFSRIGGKIIINCEYFGSVGNSDSYVMISFQDDGPGFSDDDKTKLFTKFAKLSARPTSDEPSTGLGLSIVKKLVDLLNGEIELNSNYGEGATFYLKFPVK